MKFVAMKLPIAGVVAGLMTSVVAVDLLFVSDFVSWRSRADPLGKTVETVSTAVFEGMTTEQFATYGAIIISDRTNGQGGCATTRTELEFLNRAKTSWAPAIKGNILILGKSGFIRHV